MNVDISVDYVLFRLNEIFKVKYISKELVTARDIKEAMSIKSQMDFDRIPIKVNGKITIYYDSNSNSKKKISPEEIISESTGILETLRYLSKRDFYFVLSGSDITHIVHYSDLNNPLVLTPLYTQISYCEIAIRSFAGLERLNNTQNEIENFLNKINLNIKSNYKINVKRAVNQYKKKVKNQTQTDLFDELYLDDELILLRELFSMKLDSNQFKKFNDYIDLSDTYIKSYNDLRIKIMHAKPEIINQKSDISKWLDFMCSCQKAINVLNGKVRFQ